MNETFFFDSFSVVTTNLMFNSGSDVNLTCSNKTWKETIYVIWNMTLTNKICQVSFSNGGEGKDSCTDFKSLRNTSRGQSYLHIPNFSTKDVGVYECNFVYQGGKEDYKINVAMTGRTGEVKDHTTMKKT